MADINSYSPMSGNIIGADNRAYNIVDLLKGKTPVNDQIYDITKYPPIGGIVIGNDGRAYDLTELIRQMVITAYQIAVSHGYTGTEAEWLASLKGEPGKDGATAYEQAVAAGFTGTKSEWLASLKGEPGKDGATAYEQAVTAGFTGTKSEWLASLKGEPGNNGATAYELAVAGGYTGTQAQWLKYLRQGPEGASAYELAVAGGYTGTQAQWLNSLKGENGPNEVNENTATAFNDLLMGNGTKVRAATKGTDYAGPDQIANANLLHNWDFRNPIDQRGSVTNGTAINPNYQYFIDRWVGKGTITFYTATGLLLAQGASIRQYMELEYTTLLGKSLMVSWLDSGGTTRTGKVTFPTAVSGTADVYGASVTLWNLSVSLGFRYGNTAINGTTRAWTPMIRLTATAQTTVAAVKAETGSIGTLAMDAPQDPAAALALCQRYYMVLAPWCRARSTQLTSGLMDFPVTLPASMRVAPSINGTLVVATLSNSVQSDFTFALLSMSGGFITIRATKASHGLTDACMYCTADVGFSADL
jgi:hypothetical protein